MAARGGGEVAADPRRRARLRLRPRTHRREVGAARRRRDPPPHHPLRRGPARRRRLPREPLDQRDAGLLLAQHRREDRQRAVPHAAARRPGGRLRQDHGAVGRTHAHRRRRLDGRLPLDRARRAGSGRLALLARLRLDVRPRRPPRPRQGRRLVPALDAGARLRGRRQPRDARHLPRRRQLRPRRLRLPALRTDDPLPQPPRTGEVALFPVRRPRLRLRRERAFVDAAARRPHRRGRGTRPVGRPAAGTAACGDRALPRREPRRIVVDRRPRRPPLPRPRLVRPSRPRRAGASHPVHRLC